MSAWYARMIGPLPAGAWLGVVAGGVTGGVFLSRHKAAGDPLAAGLESAGGGAVNLADSSAPVSSGGGDDTNAKWETRAIKALIAHGYQPLLAQQALEKFLHGDQLTAEEAEAVNDAIMLVGPPPDGAPAAVTPPPAAGGGGTLPGWSGIDWNSPGGQDLLHQLDPSNFRTGGGGHPPGGTATPVITPPHVVRASGNFGRPSSLDGTGAIPHTLVGITAPNIGAVGSAGGLIPGGASIQLPSNVAAWLGR